MKKFLMICYVAADFAGAGGEMFRVTPEKIGTFIEAPEWVKETLLFKWLLSDGSIKVAYEQISMKDGENDPMKGIAADGKEIKPEEPKEEPKEAEEAEEKKTTKSRKAPAKKKE